MVQRLPTGYVFDPDDPRAPSVEQWARMLPDERARVVAMLPSEVPQSGRFASAVFGLEGADEIARLGSMLDKVIAGQEEAERRAEELAGKLADAEQQLAEARAEIERLKKGPS